MSHRHRRSRRNPGKRLPGKAWVQVMESNREYGGPEEGGWWYTTIESLVPAHHVAAGSALNLAKKLAKRHRARLHIQRKSDWPDDRGHDRFVWVGSSRQRERGHQHYE